MPRGSGVLLKATYNPPQHATPAVGKLAGFQSGQTLVMATAKKKPRSKPPVTRGNSTILIGANLLGVVSRFNGPTTLTRIAEAAEMSPSRAYRYLRGLVDSGLIQQNPATGRYDLGPQVLELGLAAISRLDPVREAMSVLPDVSQRTGLVTTISVWGSFGPTVIRCEHGNLAAPIRIREGVVLPLLATAAGNVFLAFASPVVTGPLLENEIEEWNAIHKGREAMSRKRVDGIQTEVRKHGMARVVGARTAFHANLAAPIFGRDGTLELVMTLVGVRGRFDSSYTGEAATALKESAQEVSRRLGAPDHS